LDEKIHAVVNARRSHSSDARNDGKMQFNSTALSIQHSAFSTQHSASNGSTWHLALSIWPFRPLMVAIQTWSDDLVQGLNAEC
jgi:hypothetical protein